MAGTISQYVFTKTQNYDGRRKDRTGRPISFLLTEDQVQQKLDEAGITIDQVRPGGYVLGRLNDLGDYTMDNCRFITHEQNISEQVPYDRSQMSDEAVERQRAGAARGGEWWKGKKYSEPRIVVCPHCGKEGHPGPMKRHHFDNCKEYS